MELLLIDNYDSFTYNLVHYLAEVGGNCKVIRNDKITTQEIININPKAVVLSPGPCKPEDSGVCLDFVKTSMGKIPILGVCMGHQVIVQAYGGSIIKAAKPMHAKINQITNLGKGIFKNTPQKFDVTLYNSLVASSIELPACLQVTAFDQNETIMAVQHKKFNIHGVQFHPESIASQHGHDILRNFIKSL